MNPIKPAFHDFLNDLSNNNKKDWFDLNRKNYELNVKKPFEDLVEIVHSGIKEFDPIIDEQWKKSIFRINRDIRFSPDKTPYKTSRSAYFSPSGKNAKIDVGYYFSIENRQCTLGAGIYNPDTETLNKIKQEIYYHLEEFQNILKDKAFQKQFPTFYTERFKTIPPKVKAYESIGDFIYYKSFIVTTSLNEKQVASDNFSDTIISALHHTLPLVKFLRNALD
ncbi:MAG: DUF2461 domain-containing protein [Chitinophagales bacterium]|jgi:uncharacterized protein (TIGR02453 family)|nr:DUF2461 domain-containing protein [Chitinophagales bacterium]